MTTFRCALATGALAAIAAGCAVDPPSTEPLGRVERPLIGGTLDADDPAVAALTRGGTGAFCTATLISPSVLLTAAHCIDMAGNDPSVIAFFGADTRGDGTKIGIQRKQQHLGWTGNLANGHDIGLLLLNFPHPDPMLPLRLNESSPADRHIDDPYRHVGFGVFDRETQASDGRKRQGTTTISNTVSDVILSGDEALSVCFGDSGGPGLLTIDGEEVIAGVHSYTTGSDCNPPNGDTRVDLYAAEFVIPWIQDNDPRCQEDGVCAPIGCLDDPDCLPCGPNGTCTEGCALPDPDCPTSATGELCRADTQCLAADGRCVYWKDDPNYRFCTVPCTPGGGGCPDGMSCQTINPFGDVCYFDDQPPGVLGDRCEQATDCGSYTCVDDACTRACNLGQGMGCPQGFECAASADGSGHYCFPLPDEGGCQAGGGAGGGGALLLLAAAIGLRRRRR